MWVGSTGGICDAQTLKSQAISKGGIMEDVTATLYAIRACGYYRDEVHRFAKATEVFKDFTEWARGCNSIGETSTYTPSEDDGFLSSFCMDARELAIPDVFALATWNEMPTVEDGVQILSVGSRVGHAHVSNVNIDALSLPGYPAYYCVDTRNQLAVNFRFEQRLNGSRQFQKFIQGFLQGYSQWCVWNQQANNELLGYSENNPNNYDDSLEPNFSTGFVRVPGKVDYIRQNVNRVRKVIRRAYVSPKVAEEKSFIDKSFEILGLQKNNRLRAPMPYEYRLKIRLTLEQLNGVIDEFQHGDAGDTWNDTGFIFAKESQTPYWLSGSLARDKTRIDVGREQEGNLIDMDSFVAYLNGHLAELVRNLREPA